MARSALLVLLLVGTASACPRGAGPAAKPGTAVASDAGLAAAMRTWHARRPDAYAYTLAISCMCIHRGAYAVEVRGTEITSVRDATTGVPSPESRASWVVTVDRLFEAMQQAAELGTPVRASYHPQLGYPVEAEIGLLADDSGTLYTIEDLRAL